MLIRPHKNRATDLKPTPKSLRRVSRSCGSTGCNDLVPDPREILGVTFIISGATGDRRRRCGGLRGLG